MGIEKSFKKTEGEIMTERENALNTILYGNLQKALR